MWISHIVKHYRGRKTGVQREALCFRSVFSQGFCSIWTEDSHPVSYHAAMLLSHWGPDLGNSAYPLMKTHRSSFLTPSVGTGRPLALPSSKVWWYSHRLFTWYCHLGRKMEARKMSTDETWVDWRQNPRCWQCRSNLRFFRLWGLPVPYWQRGSSLWIWAHQEATALLQVILTVCVLVL